MPTPSTLNATQQDPLAAAKSIVEQYLAASMVPDPEIAATFVGDPFVLTFTGGRRFDTPTGATGFNAKRYAWVKKEFVRTDAVYDPESGSYIVYNSGYLYGAWPDGTEFAKNRYLDRFFVKNDKIINMDVWNDSAEILLDKAGLSEAPL
jgi:hypothetical protein